MSESNNDAQVEHIHLNMNLARSRNSVRNLKVDTSLIEEDVEIEVNNDEDEIMKLDKLSPVPSSMLSGQSKVSKKKAPSAFDISNLKDKTHNPKPILKQSSSYLDGHGSPIHRKEKSRNLQFADAIGKDLHEVNYSENLQYSPNAVGGQFWDDNSTEEEDPIINGRACCTIS